MKVKICGITTLEDALAAIEAGADMLGFNFYPPSPRYIEPVTCARLVQALRAEGASVTTVGVFVNAPVQELTAILEDCGLDLVQLHGDEPPEAVAQLGERALKALRPADLASARALSRTYPARRAAPAFLVDTSTAGQYGGTGRVADWSLARALAAEYQLLLAGGLHPGNVAAAVGAVQPWGVDVASGVEERPGRKDPARMVAFVRAAHGIEVTV